MAGGNNDEKKLGAILSRDTGISVGLMIALLGGALFVANEMGEFKVAQLETREAIDDLQSDLHHENELHEAALRLWISQLRLKNPDLDIPDFGRARRD